MEECALGEWRAVNADVVGPEGCFEVVIVRGWEAGDVPECWLCAC